MLNLFLIVGTVVSGVVLAFMAVDALFEKREWGENY